MRDELIKAAEHQKKEAETERKKKVALRLQCVKEVQYHQSQFSEIFQKIHHELK